MIVPRNIRLPGKAVANELQMDNEWNSNKFVDIGRLRLNRKKQRAGIEYFRIKSIPDTVETHRLLNTLGLTINDTVDSMKMTAKTLLHIVTGVQMLFRITGG